MASLTLDGLTKSYGDVAVVKSVSLEVRDGEFLVLLGPSGCGKTTTLRMIAGFVPPSGGSIRIGDQDITSLPPWKRNAGLVFQSYALFPHMTVAQNVAFGLEMRKASRSEIGPRVADQPHGARRQRGANRGDKGGGTLVVGGNHGGITPAAGP